MAASKAKKAVDHWAKKAFKKSHKGRLHRALGVKEGEKIPGGKKRRPRTTSTSSQGRTSCRER